MIRKLYDIQWPVTPKTLEDINANFDAVYDVMTGLQGSLAGTGAIGHDILSFTHTDSTKANCARGDLIIGSGASPTWTRLAKGTAGYVLTMGANEPAWATAVHAMLSATHSDSTAAAVQRGDVIIGSGTPASWTRLAKGTAAYVLTMGADEPAWSAIPIQTSELLSATHTDTTAHAVVRGDMIVGSGATPKWVALAKGTTGYFLKMGADEPGWAVHGLTYSDVGALAAGGTAVDSDKLDGQHGSYYAIAGDAPAAHVLDGALHTVSGETPGYFLKALTATTFGFAAHGLSYADVGALAVGATAADSDKLDGQHGSYYAIAGAAPAAHQLDGALHTVSGLTTGYFLKALSATTFGFAAHGLTYGSVGAAAASHTHVWADITSGLPATWAPSAHNVLSSYHGDSTEASVVRGDLITGQGAPARWTRLALGTTGYFLKATATDAVWAAHGLTYTDVGAAATSHTHAWADVNKSGSSLADLATRAVANLSDGSNVALLNAATIFTGAYLLVQKPATNMILGSRSDDGYYAALQVKQTNEGNWLVYNPASSTDLRFYDSTGTAGDRLTLTTTGNLGLGITAPASAGSGITGLDLRGASGASIGLGLTASQVSLIYSGTGYLIISTQTAAYMAFTTNATERMRILSGGNVGIGVTAPSVLLEMTDASSFKGPGNIIMGGGTTLPAWAGSVEFNNEAGVGFHIRSYSVRFDVGAGTGSPVHPTYLGALIIFGDGTVQLSTVPAFVAGDKYMVMDTWGNIHKSAVGPAS